MAKLSAARVIKKLHAVKVKKIAALKRGLYKCGLYLQRLSMELVPIDTAALKNSARTHGPFQKGKTKIEVWVTYGTEYGIYVHEDLDAWHAPGTQAKFLEEPFRWRQYEFREIIKEEMRDT